MTCVYIRYMYVAIHIHMYLQHMVYMQPHAEFVSSHLIGISVGLTVRSRAPAVPPTTFLELSV